MKRLLLPLLCALALGALAPGASAQSGGSVTNPIWQRRSQGNWVLQKSVACTVDTALLTATETANALSIYCQNMQTTGGERIGICARAAAAGACDGTAKYSARLDAEQAWTTDVSAAGRAYSCDGVGGSYTLNCHVESWFPKGNQNPTPVAPTPIPTPTP